MGFLEEKKVFLSTAHADSHADGMSSATWLLKTPLETLNPLYKMKVKVSNTSLPNTFDRISEQLGNNKLTFAFSDPGQPLNPANAANTVTIEVRRPFYSGQEDALLDHINNQLVRATQAHPFLKDAVYRPLFVSDANSTHCGLVMQNYFDAGDVYDAVFEGTPPPATPNEIQFKLLTQADFGAMGGNLTKESFELKVGLANVLGFSRTQNARTMTPTDKANAVDGLVDPFQAFTNAETVDRQSEFFGIRDIVRPRTAMDVSGVRFISVVMPEFNIANVDPVTLDTSRVIACLPVTSRFEGDATPLVTAVQDNPYITMAQDRIHKITIELRDDHGRPLHMHHDWFMELSVRIEEPDQTDAYRGTADLVLPAGAFAADPDPGKYAKLQNELKRSYAMLGAEESSAREAAAARFRR